MLGLLSVGSDGRHGKNSMHPMTRHTKIKIGATNKFMKQFVLRLCFLKLVRTGNATPWYMIKYITSTL